MKNQIYPCIWFDGKAKEAAEFYCSLFKKSIITTSNPMVVAIELVGQKFMLLNGGPMFKINPTVSFFVVCETEEEVEKTWGRLIVGGSVLMPLDTYEWSKKYGWVQDKFGVNWQLSFGKMADVGQKFTPVLMFTGNQHGRAEQAINYYTSAFENSSIRGILRYAENDDDITGTIKHAQFTLDKTVFMCMDSSYPHAFQFNEAISFVIECETQNEIDFYWEKLSAVPEAEQCGWLKDKFGISWQIIPTILAELMSDPIKAPKVVEAFMQMKKFNIEKLKQA